MGFTVTREEGEDVKEGGYALSVTATNANYSVTVEEGSVLTITKRPLHYVLSVKNMNGNETDGYSLEYGAFSETANLAASIVSGEGYYTEVTGERVTVTPKLPGEIKNVGTYTINAIDAAYGETTLESNYEIKLDNTVSFKIVAKAVTVTIIRRQGSHVRVEPYRTCVRRTYRSIGLYRDEREGRGRERGRLRLERNGYER